MTDRMLARGIVPLVVFILLGTPATALAQGAPGNNAVLHVRVTGAEGSFLEGAGGLLLAVPGGMDEGPTANPAPGELVFESPFAGPRVLRVHAPGHYAADEAVRLVAGGTTEVTVSLERIPHTREVAVIVAGAGPLGERPVALANVLATWAGQDAAGRPRTSIAELRTDLEGRAFVPVPPSGRLRVEVQQDFLTGARAERALDIAGPREIHLVLQATAGTSWAQGRVLGVDGAPVPGTLVRLFLPLGSDPTWIETRLRAAADAEGRYQLPMPAGLVRISAEGPAYFEERLDRDLPQGVHALDVTLVPQPARDVAVTARLVGPRGEPLQGAAVAALAWVGSHPITASEVSDAEGRFRLQVPDIPFKLLVACTDGCARDGETLDAVLRLHPAAPTLDLGDVRVASPLFSEGHVHGRVVDDKGAPVARATVFLFDLARERVVADATADEQGAFQLPAAAEGDLRLVVRGPGASRGIENLLAPTGYQTVLAPLRPGAQEVGDVILAAVPAAEARFSLRLDPSGVTGELRLRFVETEPLLRSLLVDGLLGDADGTISDDELARAVEFARKVQPAALGDVLLHWGGKPIAMGPGQPRFVLEEGRVVLVESSRTALPPAGRGVDFDVTIPQAPGVAVGLDVAASPGLDVTSHHSEDVPAAFIAGPLSWWFPPPGERPRDVTVTVLVSEADAAEVPVRSVLPIAAMGFVAVVAAVGVGRRCWPLLRR